MCTHRIIESTTTRCKHSAEKFETNKHHHRPRAQTRQKPTVIATASASNNLSSIKRKKKLRGRKNTSSLPLPHSLFLRGLFFRILYVRSSLRSDLRLLFPRRENGVCELHILYSRRLFMRKIYAEIRRERAIYAREKG